MLLVKDAMVLIHLAKITLLEASCECFGRIAIPGLVYDEVMEGKGHADAELIRSLVSGGKISVRKAERELIKRAELFGIFGGEAEAVALYWEEKADLLATDDDNVRKKQEMLDLRLIGTPAIMVQLYRRKKITRDKFKSSVLALRKIGWFSSSIFDKLLMEAE